jgi:hypothetical protein
MFALILLFFPVISTLVLLLLQGQLMVITFRGWGRRVKHSPGRREKFRKEWTFALAVS